ncbi:MAG: hypothetical protein JRF59_00500 [Deltaproteobacteria bacterium]|nr:hypothetical protein [Deltaproteobacteria bacterium]MBW1921937.1 hypothetical protein [Deltaproteobacteria bacterium]MBW1948795.1 hypothetical protein [Deltaproteobacteria bacterium]MBW2006472.1 hypothetical protein [Deltaproteobacteria bacterium]MBW2101168.1 hypothetical protein [Deltaproteobacteria bacterium]
MKRTILFLFPVGLFLVATGILLGSTPARGADMTLVPSLDVRGEYNDNVSFLRRNEQDDYIATVSPGITFDYSTQRLEADGRALVDVVRYAEEDQLDTENQRYEFDGTYRCTERWTVTGRASYIKDTTLESELEETGLVGVRADRNRWTGGGGVSYSPDLLSEAALDYFHGDYRYDWRGNIDYTYDSVVGSYKRRMKNERSEWILQPYYSNTESKASEVDNYGLSVGVAHFFTETLSTNAFLGVRRTYIDYTLTQPQVVYNAFGFPVGVTYTRVKEKDRKWGWVADISLKHQGETQYYTAGYNRDLSYSSFGEPVERQRLYANTGLRLHQRLEARFSASLYYVKSEGKFHDENRRYVDLTPSLHYRLTEDYSLSFGYNYSHDYDKSLSTDQKKDRHRAWVSVNFRFPKKI